MTLELYKKKRNFKKTPEPSKSKREKKSQLSFVVQRHDASHLHYDFRLEMEGVLKSWAVPKGPSMVAGEKRLAVMVEDHPFSYGSFSGEIPKGNYGAGTVDIWDNGTYEPLENPKNLNSEKLLLSQLKKGDLKFTVNGKHLKGAFALVRMHSESGEDKNWLLIKKKDDYAVDHYNIEEQAPIKPSGKRKKNISDKISKKVESGNVPDKKNSSDQTKSIEQVWEQLKSPMLTKLTDKVVDDPNWLYEIKYDGYRALTKISKGKVEMNSRNGNSFNKQYSSLITELEKIQEEVILDGEVVIEDKNGVSNFQLLQNYNRTKEGTLKYYVFDILYLNGYRTTEVPLHQRKELLEAFFQKYTPTNIFKSGFAVEKGKQLFKELISKGYEGVIAKNMESTYHSGKRTDDWLKIKGVKMQEAVICGYTLPQKSRKYFGSLVLGLYENKKLSYIGNCGTGFTEASLKELHVQFEKLKTDKCPFEKIPTMTGSKGKVIWLKPELVCNVKFAEFTQEKHLRAPVFMGLRTDKEAREVVEETVKSEIKIKGQNEESNFTNLDKVYFPEDDITKGDLIAYYQRISDFILPYLKDRPQSLNRHPNGIYGESFYQKNMEVAHLPKGLKTVKVYSKSNEEYINYLICNNEETLLYMANLGCIEIHPWHSTYQHPDHPNYIILDLDPGEISFEEVVNTALVIKELCDELKINSYCKTSGATGLHVYIPIGKEYIYEEAKTFAELLARLAHERLPDTTSIERSVSKRKDKIYIDFLQNRKGQTIAAPYSVRPYPHATVSTPLLWKEVNPQLSPKLFTIHTIEKRLSRVGDLWKEVLEKSLDLPAVLKRINKGKI
jgi:bifunctional non-homologous end joining protein LigD